MRSAMCCTTPRSWETMMMAVLGRAADGGEGVEDLNARGHVDGAHRLIDEDHFGLVDSAGDDDGWPGIGLPIRSIGYLGSGSCQSRMSVMVRSRIPLDIFITSVLHHHATDFSVFSHYMTYNGVMQSLHRYSVDYTLIWPRQWVEGERVLEHSPDSRRRPRIPRFSAADNDWLSYSTLPESADSKPSIMRVVDCRIRAADHGQTFAGVDVGGDVGRTVACGARAEGFGDGVGGEERHCCYSCESSLGVWRVRVWAGGDRGAGLVVWSARRAGRRWVRIRRCGRRPARSSGWWHARVRRNRGGMKTAWRHRRRPPARSAGPRSGVA